MRINHLKSYLAILLFFQAFNCLAVESFEFHSKLVRAKILLNPQETEFHLNDNITKFKNTKIKPCTKFLTRLKDDLSNKVLKELMNSKAFSIEKKDKLSYIKIDGVTFYSLSDLNDTKIAYQIDELYKISISASVKCKE
jgi:hypothetical protein